MSAELIGALVGLVSSLGILAAAVTTYVKQRTKIEATQTEIRAITDARAETATRRDNEMQELRETVTKTTWDINRIKDEMSHRDNLLEDLRAQLSALNTTMAVVGQKLDILSEVIKELKEHRQC